MLDDQVAYLVGQAMGHLQGQPPQRGVRQMTPQKAVERASRSVGRAFQLYLQAGLTQAQAVQRIVALAQTFGSLE
jgi:hypothetical protein